MSKRDVARRRKAGEAVAMKRLVGASILHDRRIKAERQISEAKALIASIQAEVASVPRI